MSGIMLNWDDSAFFYYISRGYGKDVANREQAYECCRAVIDQYKDTGITDFLICVNARLASYPSTSIENYGDSAKRKIQNNKEVDFSRTWASSFPKVFEEWGVDYIDIWIKRLLEINILPWVSVRMNDAHDMLASSSFIAPNYYYENPQLRRVTHHKDASYYDYIFDYGKEEVRTRFLSFIEETLNRYDTYGLELDWLREAFCFKVGHEYEGIQIINDFMRQVKAIVQKYEKIRNHKIKIAARIPSGIETALYMGFDAVTWAEEALVDLIVISPRWSTTDTDMPIEIWKRMLKTYNVELAAGIEVVMRENRKSPTTFNCAETVVANAASIYSAGADKLYLFNYLSMPDMIGADTSDEGYMNLFTNIKTILKNSKDIESAIRCNRRHFVSFKDLTAQWELTKYYVPVTCSPKDTEYALFRIRTGKVLAESKAHIMMGIDVQDGMDLKSEDISVYLNSMQLNGIKRLEQKDFYVTSPLYIVDVDDTSLLKEINSVEVCSNSKVFIITHIEIAIMYLGGDND